MGSGDHKGGEGIERVCLHHASPGPRRQRPDRYPLSGNAAAGTHHGQRPANWWDTIGFGHEDAFSNALAFRACSLLAEAARSLTTPPWRTS